MILFFQSQPTSSGYANYYAARWLNGHCKYMSRKTIAFWAMRKINFSRAKIASNQHSKAHIWQRRSSKKAKIPVIVFSQNYWGMFLHRISRSILYENNISKFFFLNDFCFLREMFYFWQFYSNLRFVSWNRMWFVIVVNRMACSSGFPVGALLSTARRLQRNFVYLNN